MSISKKCIVCGKEFTAKNDKGIYCSPSCRVKAHRRREKEGKTELEKNISENYAAELDFFRTKVNHLFEEVSMLRNELVSSQKFIVSLTERFIALPLMPDISALESSVENLSNKFDDELTLRSKNMEKVNKNEYNIKLIGLKIKDIVHEINRDKPQSSSESIIDRVLSNDNLIGFIQGIMETKNTKSEKPESSEEE